MKFGRVVLLNGPTSSGKTSIARAFQQLSDEPWMRTGIDVFWSSIDARWMELGSRADEGFRWVDARPSEDGPAEMSIVPGPVGERLAAGMRAAIAALASEGNDVVVDDVLIESAWLDGWAHVLSGLETLFVGVHCDLETLERRERERGNRILGEARGQHGHVHGAWPYDVEVDTTTTSPDGCARAIADAVVSAPHPRALDRVRERS